MSGIFARSGPELEAAGTLNSAPGFAETARATVIHEEHEFRCWWAVAGVHAATCGESSGGFSAPATGGRTGLRTARFYVRRAKLTRRVRKHVKSTPVPQRADEEKTTPLDHANSSRFKRP